MHTDNVVRAGLTPKLRDVPTLVDMLTYTWGPASTQLMRPTSYPSSVINSNSLLYDPPIEEFSVLLTNLLNASTAEETLPAVDGPGILIVTELGQGGASLHVNGAEIRVEREGQVFFVGAGTEVALKGKLVAYTAFVEVPADKKAAL